MTNEYLAPRKPTVAQQVYDAIAQGITTKHDLVIMFGRWRAISGLHQLRVMGKIQCDKIPRYSLTPDAERPKDRRGRKRV